MVEGIGIKVEGVDGVQRVRVQGVEGKYQLNWNDLWWWVGVVLWYFSIRSRLVGIA